MMRLGSFVLLVVLFFDGRRLLGLVFVHDILRQTYAQYDISVIDFFGALGCHKVKRLWNEDDIRILYYDNGAAQLGSIFLQEDNKHSLSISKRDSSISF